ncbi:hypothetical protein [Pectobacterium versatile]|uniref:hypothetical protein n=1 Tax=Pectobacterium versatile TaxID=2488639 RepID=UPI001F492BE6|nr:hypothetical protein [Pectobacterium versatile]
MKLNITFRKIVIFTKYESIEISFQKQFDAICVFYVLKKNDNVNTFKDLINIIEENSIAYADLKYKDKNISLTGCKSKLKNPSSRLNKLREAHANLQ